MVQSVEPEKVASLRTIFKGEEDARIALDAHFNSVMSYEVITKKEARQARDLRLKIVKYRIALEKKRKSGKLEHTRAIRAIDSITKLLLLGIGDKEAKLKEREDYPAQQEELRIEEITRERKGILDAIYAKPGAPSTPEYLSAPIVLGAMSADNWEQYKNQQEGMVANVIRIAELEAQLAQSCESSLEKVQEVAWTPPPVDTELDKSNATSVVNVQSNLFSAEPAEAWDDEESEISSTVIEPVGVEPSLVNDTVPDASQVELVDTYKKTTESATPSQSDSERLRAFALLLHKVGKENTPLVLQDKALQDKLDGWLFSFAGMLKALAEMGEIQK